MRSKTLYLLRGLQGSGKSTFILEHNLTKFTVSNDQIKLDLGAVRVNEDGKKEIRYEEKLNAYVNFKLLEQIEERMAKGETIFVDNLNIKTRDLRKFKVLVQKYGYESIIIDFLPLVDIEESLRRNKVREEIKRLPEEAILKNKDYLKNLQNPTWVDKIILPTEYK